MKFFPLIALACLVGCATPKSKPKVESTAEAAKAQTTWGRSHQFNNAGKDVTTEDIDNDQRPDVIRIASGGVLEREEWDLNGDGQPEVWRYFDANGKTIEEEWDADYDGKPDVISYYENDVMVRREQSSNFLGRMSTRKHYAGGVITLVEQDTDDDGTFDTWEHYQEGALTQVGRDTNGDGKEDQVMEPTPQLKALAPSAETSKGTAAEPGTESKTKTEEGNAPTKSDGAEPATPSEGDDKGPEPDASSAGAEETKP